MDPHADDTPGVYRAALMAAFDGPIPGECHAALGRMERAARNAALLHAVEAETSALRADLRRMVALRRSDPGDASAAPALARRWSTYRCAMAQRRMLRLAEACASRAQSLTPR